MSYNTEDDDYDYDGDIEMVSVEELHLSVIDHCNKVINGEIDMSESMQEIIDTFDDDEDGLYASMIEYCREVLDGNINPIDLAKELKTSIITAYLKARLFGG